MDDCDAMAWGEMRRALRSVLAVEPTQALVEAVRAGSGREPELTAAVRAWRQQVLQGLEQRIRSAKARGGGAAALECLPALLSFESRLVGKVAQCAQALCAAVAADEQGRASGILRRALIQYFYDAWIELNPSPHRRRNWHKMQREIIHIRRDWQHAEQGSARLAYRDDRNDCAELADELLARSRDAAHPFRMNDVSTLDGVFSYLWEFLPDCGAGPVAADAPAYLPDPVTVRDALAQCLPEVALPPRQRRAVQDAFFAEREPEMSVAERKQHRKALTVALRRLLPCLQRYVDGGDAQ